MSEPGLSFEPVGPDHYETFREYVDYAFHPTAGPQDHEDEFDRIAAPFGIFDGDDLLSICAHYDFTARVRGEWIPLAGLAAVATPPEHRRRGLVGRMVDASLERWRGDAPLAALWPFSRPYYEQFGWATANTAFEYVIPIEQLSFARGTATGRPRRVTADDWAALDDAYEERIAGEALGVRRDERWWRERVFETLEDESPYVYAWERDGDVRGHVAYTFESAGDGLDDRRIEVADLVAADEDAFRGLLGLFADHDSQASEVKLYRPDSTLLDRLPAPGDVDCSVHTGPMVRVVDVCDALSTMPFPADANADLTLAVSDTTAPWNDDVFALDVSGGRGTCERVGADRTDVDASSADVTVDVGTLSQLVVGYRDVTDLRRIGELSIDDEAVGADLAALFPPQRVVLRDFF